MPRVITSSFVVVLLVASSTAASEQLASRVVQLESQDEHRALGRPISFNGEDGTWRDWSAVFRSYTVDNATSSR